MQKAFVLLLFCGALQFACSSAAPTFHSQTPDIPAKFTIDVGEGGGFTGLWSGYSIVTGDTLLVWSGKSMGENPRYAGTLQHDTITALWSTISADHLIEKPSIDTSSNFTRTVVISANGAVHRFSWIPTSTPDTAIAAVSAFRDRCLRAIHQALNR